MGHARDRSYGLRGIIHLSWSCPSGHRHSHCSWRASFGASPRACLDVVVWNCRSRCRLFGLILDRAEIRVCPSPCVAVSKQARPHNARRYIFRAARGEERFCGPFCRTSARGHSADGGDHAYAGWTLSRSQHFVGSDLGAVDHSFGSSLRTVAIWTRNDFDKNLPTRTYWGGSNRRRVLDAPTIHGAAVNGAAAYERQGLPGYRADGLSSPWRKSWNIRIFARGCETSYA